MKAIEQYFQVVLFVCDKFSKWNLRFFTQFWTLIALLGVKGLIMSAINSLQLEGRLKKKEPEEQKFKEEVDEKVQVIIYCQNNNDISINIVVGDAVA